MTSELLLERYQEEWANLGHEMVVINLSWNDTNTSALAVNLARLVGMNRRLDVDTLFVLEAHSSEQFTDHRETALAMYELGAAGGVPVFDAYEFTKEGDAYGIMWWDNVHPTSFGHWYLARGIASFIKIYIDDSPIRLEAEAD